MNPMIQILCLTTLMAAACARAGEPQAVLFARPGVTADRGVPCVRVAAQATGLKPGEPMEFVLIGPGSGHDYEALAISKARPSDVHAALEHIGVTAGAPVNEAALQFWPQGARVTASLQWTDPTNTASLHRVPVAQAIRDNRNPARLDSSEFLFVGSRAAPSLAAETGTCYAADEYDPQSIISTYNTPATVLDIPYRGGQGEEYGHISAALALDKGLPIEFVLEPAQRPGCATTWRDITLRVEPAASTGGVRYTLHETETNQVAGPTDLDGLEPALIALGTNSQDVYVTLDAAPTLPLWALPPACNLLRKLDRAGRIRMLPPPAGQLYFRAYIPDPAWRDRATRDQHPWELFLWDAGSATGILERVREEWAAGTHPPQRTIERHSVPAPAALAGIVATNPNPLAVMLIYAPAGMTRGEIQAWTDPVKTNLPLVHIFTD